MMVRAFIDQKISAVASSLDGSEMNRHYDVIRLFLLLLSWENESPRGENRSKGHKTKQQPVFYNAINANFNIYWMIGISILSLY